MSNYRLPASAGVVVVDVQDLTVARIVSMPPPRLLENVGRVVAAGRAAGVPVAHALTFGMPPGTTRSGVGGRRWSTSQDAVPDQVRPETGEVLVERAAWSAFAGTDLHEQLQQRGVTLLVVVGLATPSPELPEHEWTLTHVVPRIGRTASVEEITRSPGGFRVGNARSFR